VYAIKAKVVYCDANKVSQLLSGDDAMKNNAGIIKNICQSTFIVL